MRGWTDIDWTAPVNRFHPLNRGRLLWLLTVPGLTGSNTWIDLVNPTGKHSGALSNMERTDWKPASGRPGDWGHLEFGGTDESVLVTGLSGLIDPNVGTYLGWVRLDPMSENGFVWEIRVDASNNMGLRWVDSSNQMDFRHKASDVISNVLTATPTENSIWHFISMTWDTGVADVLKAYEDGLLLGSDTSGLGTYVGTPTQIRIGAADFLGEYMIGAQAEISFFNRVLSPDEIYEHYLLSQQGYPDLLNRLQPRSWLAQVIGNTPDTDAAIFTLGQQQPIIEPFVMIPY